MRMNSLTIPVLFILLFGCTAPAIKPIENKSQSIFAEIKEIQNISAETEAGLEENQKTPSEPELGSENTSIETEIEPDDNTWTVQLPNKKPPVQAEEPLPTDLTLRVINNTRGCASTEGGRVLVCGGDTSEMYYQFGLAETGNAYDIMASINCSTPIGSFRLNEEYERWGGKYLGGGNDDLVAAYSFYPFNFDDKSGIVDIETAFKASLPKGTAVQFVLYFEPKRAPLPAYCDIDFVSSGETIYSTTVQVTFKKEEEYNYD